MNLLIIGGTGILSTAVVTEAINKGIDVTMINRGYNKKFINPRAELIIGDVRNNPSEIKDKLKNRHFDAIIDFIVWTKEHLELSLSLFSKISDQYVFISSAQAYNTSVKGILTEESEKCQPLWNYSVNKCKAEEFLKKYCAEHNVNYTIIRPGVNYGPTRIPYGMFPAIGYHWTLVERIKAGKIIPTWNYGVNKLNLTRVEDLAQGTIGLIGNIKAYNEDFNVVGDYVYNWQDVLTALGDILKVEVKTLDLPVDYYASELTGDEKEGLLGGRSKDLVCSNEKLKNVFPGFSTKYDLKTGLRMTLQAYVDNNYFQGFDYVYEGKTDRIINKYIKKTKIPCVKQKFINYAVGDNTILNWINYKEAYFAKSGLKYFFKVIKKIIHK